MGTVNFGSLREQWPDLYTFGSEAEAYVHTDPQVALFKMRCFAESLVATLYKDWQLDIPTASFFEMLRGESFRERADPTVQQKLHTIRITGNKAVHGRSTSPSDASRLLEDAYLLGKWLYLTHSNADPSAYPAYTPPPPPPVSGAVSLPQGHLEALTEARAQLEDLEQATARMSAENARLRDTLDQAKVQDILDAAVRAAAKIDFKANDTSNLVSVQDVFSGYELTEGQEKLVDTLGAFLTSQQGNVFLLNGYAGTGKTFITKGLTEYFRATGRNFALMAPTGKASKVIATKTGTEARTIHSSIYAVNDLVEYKDRDEDGSLTYKYYASLRTNDEAVDTVYIVDEASMLSDNYQESEFFRFGSGHVLRDLLSYVNLDHNDHRKKIIFIGDAAQLPPVGMSSSPALSADYLRREYGLASTEYELVEVVRQKAESGVLDNALRLREAIRARTFNELTIDFSKRDVEKVADQDFMQRYLDACNRRIVAGAIVVAQSNADVANFNRIIRAHFFPAEEQITAGDKVIAVNNSTGAGFFISNGDFGLVRSVAASPESRTIVLKQRSKETKELKETPVTLMFRDAVLIFRRPDGTPCQFEGKILENLLYSKEANLSSEESKALYIDFRTRNPGLDRDSLKQALRADPYFNAYRLKFGYAITCHKAQGSEWEHVFVSCHSHSQQLSAGYFRWLYTAITRTSSQLYLLGAPHLKIGAGMKPIGSDPTVGVAVAAGDLPTPGGTDAPVDAALLAHPDAEFGISRQKHPFLAAVLAKVRAAIASDPDLSIEEIIHAQYRETYFFARGDARCRIDVSYNGKGKLSSLLAPNANELSEHVLELLAPLKGAMVSSLSCTPPSDRILSKDFLKEFDASLDAQVKAIGARIDTVREFEWSLRYYFTRSDERAVFDFYYNSRDRFTKFACVAPLSNSRQLIDALNSLLAGGFQ